MKSRRAFTLIELLVVVAVIAILIGVLLPAIGQARAAAWKIVGANNQRQLMIGAYNYGAENRQYIPGLNSTGIGLFGNGSLTSESLSFRGSQPVQAYDFFSPAIGGDELSPNREQRFVQILELFADPANPLQYGPCFDSECNQSGNEEMALYLQQRGTPEIQAVSYLQPIGMVLSKYSQGKREGRTSYTYTSIGQEKDPRAGSPPAFLGGQTANQVSLPTGYIPRLDRIKNNPNKIAIADGVRYIASDGTTDFDASFTGGTYGSFTSSGAIYSESRTYGPEYAGWDIVRGLSYRHNDSLNAAMFDGSVRTITEYESRDPTLWYPTGSVFTAENRTVAEAFNYYDQGDTIN